MKWSIVVREPNGSIWQVVLDGEEANVRRMYEEYKGHPINKDNEVELIREEVDPGLN